MSPSGNKQQPPPPANVLLRSRARTCTCHKEQLITNLSIAAANFSYEGGGGDTHKARGLRR